MARCQHQEAAPREPGRSPPAAARRRPSTGRPRCASTRCTRRAGSRWASARSRRAAARARRRRSRAPRSRTPTTARPGTTWRPCTCRQAPGRRRACSVPIAARPWQGRAAWRPRACRHAPGRRPSRGSAHASRMTYSAAGPRLLTRQCRACSRRLVAVLLCSQVRAGTSGLGVCLPSLGTCAHSVARRQSRGGA